MKQKLTVETVEMMKSKTAMLEWLTVHDFAVEIGESIAAVRWAIRRRELTELGAYRGDCWRVYAVKSGRQWYIPVIRDPQSDRIDWFESRVEFERYKETSDA